MLVDLEELTVVDAPVSPAASARGAKIVAAVAVAEQAVSRPWSQWPHRCETPSATLASPDAPRPRHFDSARRRKVLVGTAVVNVNLWSYGPTKGDIAQGPIPGHRICGAADPWPTFTPQSISDRSGG